MISHQNICVHVWKVMTIILSLISSFQYAYFATFMDLMNEDELKLYKTYDLVYTIIFSVDVIDIRLQRHSSKRGLVPFNRARNGRSDQHGP